MDQVFARSVSQSPLGQSAQKTKWIIIFVIFFISFILVLSGSLIIKNGKTAQGSATLITGLAIFGMWAMYLYFRGAGIEGEAAANYRMSPGGKLVDGIVDAVGGLKRE